MGPASLEDLVTAFARLPGIGRKTAQRLALHVLKSPRQEADGLAAAITAALDNVTYCSVCYNFAERGQERCEVCSDLRRERPIDS